MTKKSPKNSHKISQFLHVIFGFLNMVSCPNCASFKKWQNLSQIYENFWSKFDEIFDIFNFHKNFATFVFEPPHRYLTIFKIFQKSCASCQFWKVVKMSKALTRTSSRWDQKVVKKWPFLMIFWMIFSSNLVTRHFFIYPL